ncbi:MAG: WecB/TagA/CpsF family glycosyltransferase [Ignavibacteriales bacterium]|nr:WecB/TagA/CpsF family glycosyltransferase [Ignavibacteriales bacterium]
MSVIITVFLDTEFENVIEKIRTAKPDVIIIGMGVPKQEIVAEKLSRSINASLFLCVGNFFEFYFGTAKRIPVRFRNKGIEWIYRLFHEPKRLWKRYLIGIPLFILRVIRFKLTLNKFG